MFGDVISGATLDSVGMDVPAEFGDARSNGSRDIRAADFVLIERTNMTEAYGIPPTNFIRWFA